MSISDPKKINELIIIILMILMWIQGYSVGYNIGRSKNNE